MPVIPASGRWMKKDQGLKTSLSYTAKSLASLSDIRHCLKTKTWVGGTCLFAMRKKENAKTE